MMICFNWNGTWYFCDEMHVVVTETWVQKFKYGSFLRKYIGHHTCQRSVWKTCYWEFSRQLHFYSLILRVSSFLQIWKTTQNVGDRGWHCSELGECPHAIRDVTSRGRLTKDKKVIWRIAHALLGFEGAVAIYFRLMPTKPFVWSRHTHTTWFDALCICWRPPVLSFSCRTYTMRALYLNGESIRAPLPRACGPLQRLCEVPPSRLRTASRALWGSSPLNFASFEPARWFSIINRRARERQLAQTLLKLG